MPKVKEQLMIRSKSATCSNTSPDRAQRSAIRDFMIDVR